MAKSLPAYTQDNQYPFSYLRMGQLGYNSPGVVFAGDMQVSPGTGLQVQISAGEAYVQQTVARLGSFYAQRGVYQIFDDSVDNPYNTITAPVSNPRVDQVIARVYDSYEQQLSGNSYWRYEWLPGTETSGAQINNPSGSGYLAGAAALPDNSLCLAYCLSTVGMNSWSSGNILNVAPFSSQNRLRPVSISSNTQALAGQEVVVTGSSSITVTLPSHVKSHKIGVLNIGTGVVTVSGTNIQGAGLSSASSFPLGSVGASAVLLDDGTNWLMIEGEQDSGWMTITSFAAHVSAGSPSPQVRLVGTQVRGRGELSFDSTGVSTNSTICTFPTSAFPSAQRSVAYAAANDSAFRNGTLSSVGVLSSSAVTGGIVSTTVSLDAVGYSI